MTQPSMVNYEIKADNEDLRDRILAWAESNIHAPWEVRFNTWDPEDDDENKWGMFVDGGTVGTRRKLLAAFQGEPFIIRGSGDSSVT